MEHDAQREAVLRYLKKHHEITPMKALMELNIYRLGARIFELREKGHHILNKEKPGKMAHYVLLQEAKDAA